MTVSAHELTRGAHILARGLPRPLLLTRTDGRVSITAPSTGSAAVTDVLVLPDAGGAPVTVVLSVAFDAGALRATYQLEPDTPVEIIATAEEAS